MYIDKSKIPFLKITIEVVKVAAALYNPIVV
jgi:hypothetical protein